jgi:hypothetical protein
MERSLSVLVFYVGSKLKIDLVDLLAMRRTEPIDDSVV